MHPLQATAAGRSRGFTLVEVVVVLAVVLLVSSLAVPVVSGYLQDGRRAQAEADVRKLAAALTRFYKDNGCYPSRYRTNNDLLSVLVSGPAVPAGNPWAAGHQFATWASGASSGDSLDHHLCVNAPQGEPANAYPTTSIARWRGPYLPGPAPLDPWGRPYVVNVIASWSTSTTQYKRLYVLSAGPNGVIDTNHLARTIDDIGGDDIGVILTERG
jgi:prepilin-type N-terminal cleavage/methylation domain-containing protein